MAFPVPQAVNGGIQATSATSHTVNLPAGIQNGDLLFAVITVTGLPSTGLATQITWPMGWTELYERIFDDAIDIGTQSLAFRRADGTEGGSITVTTDDSVFSSHTSYRLTGHHATSDPEVGSTAVGNTNPNPPSLSPSWGAEDTLWFALCGFVLDDNDLTISSAPTNYTNLREDNGGATGIQTSTGTARRELNSASDNPGIFTLTTGRRWVANTIAIRPSADIKMAIHTSLVVRPGSPDAPEFVDINCAAMELGRTVELLINGVVRATVPVDGAGNAVLTYTVPVGPIQNALTDMTCCDGWFDVAGSIFCSITTGLGDSMALRYQP